MMRVTYHTIDAFLRDLENESPERVFQRAVRVQVSKSSVPPDNVACDVTIQVSAVVSTEDGGEYLMDAGERCGRDFCDGDGEFAGSERADELRGEIERFCERTGLTVRPGFIEP